MFQLVQLDEKVSIGLVMSNGDHQFLSIHNLNLMQ